MKQTELFDYFNTKETRKRYGRSTHGGVKTKGHRKLERPLSSKKWIHLVLKSDKAKGKYNFLFPKNKLLIERTLKQKAQKFGIKIADYANVGNHLHIRVKISSRENFQKFLKSVTTLLARQITGAKRGKPFGRFWEGLAFTRVLHSARELLSLKGYIQANRIEAEHGHQAREDFRKRFNQWVYRERLQNKALINSTA